MAMRQSLLTLLLTSVTASTGKELIFTNASSVMHATDSVDPTAGRPLTLTSAQKTGLLKKHNDLRASVESPCTAADMETLTWNDNLASEAQVYAAQCVWQQDSRNGVRGWGENAAMTTNMQVDVTDMVQMWYSEVGDVDWVVVDNSIQFKGKTYPHPHRQCQSYDSANKKCTITHYTQLVWAATNMLGCGLAACSNGLMGQGGLHMVCKYNPTPNMKSGSGTFAPYLVGTPCAACTTCSSAFGHQGRLCAVNDLPARCQDNIATMTLNGVPYSDCAALIAHHPNYCGSDYDKVCKLTCNACSVPLNVGEHHCTATSASGLSIPPEARALQSSYRRRRNSACRRRSSCSNPRRRLGPRRRSSPSGGGGGGLWDSRRRRSRRRSWGGTGYRGRDYGGHDGYGLNSLYRMGYNRRRGIITFSWCNAPPDKSRLACETCFHSRQCADGYTCDEFMKKCVEKTVKFLWFDNIGATVRQSGCGYPIAQCHRKEGLFGSRCPDKWCNVEAGSREGTACKSLFWGEECECDIAGEYGIWDWYTWANLKNSDDLFSIKEPHCDGQGRITNFAQSEETRPCEDIRGYKDMDVRDPILGDGPVRVFNQCSCYNMCAANSACEGWTHSQASKMCWLRSKWTGNRDRASSCSDCVSGPSGCGCSGQVQEDTEFGGHCFNTGEDKHQWCYVFKGTCDGYGGETGSDCEHGAKCNDRVTGERLFYSLGPCNGIIPRIHAENEGTVVRNERACEGLLDGSRRLCETCFHDDQCVTGFCDPCIMKCVNQYLSAAGTSNKSCVVPHGCNSPIAHCQVDLAIGRWNGTCVGMWVDGKANGKMDCAKCTVTVNGEPITDDWVENGQVVDTGDLTQEGRRRGERRRKKEDKRLVNRNGWITWANLKSSNSDEYILRDCGAHGRVSQASLGVMRICPQIFFGIISVVFVLRAKFD